LTIRIPIRKLPLWIFLAIIALIVVVMPFWLYTYTFQSRLLSNQEKWKGLVSREYEIIVASNSLSDCTGGWNSITVSDAEIVAASNSERRNCPLASFGQLTVEALFTRIWEECIRNRPLTKPFPVCNVAYDEQLGFPRRLDTFTFNQQGEYLPSVTVERVTLHP